MTQSPRRDPDRGILRTSVSRRALALSPGALTILIPAGELGTTMEDVFVGSLMSSPVHTVGPETSLREAGRTMLDRNIGSVIVVDDDEHLEGILTATDFVRTVANGAPDPDATVDTVMSTDVTTTTADEPIRNVADLILDRGFHHVPVVDEGRVIGVITTTDLTAYVSTRAEPSPSEPSTR